MANIDLVPLFWEEQSSKKTILVTKKSAVEAFANWLDGRPQSNSVVHNNFLAHILNRYKHLLSYKGIVLIGKDKLHQFRIIINARPEEQGDKSHLGLDSVFIANILGQMGLHINDISFSKGLHDFDLTIRCYGEYEGVRCPKPQILLDELGYAQVGPTLATV